MATYFILMNYTQQGIGSIKESPKRYDAAKEVAKGLGVQIKEMYLCMGAYDLIAVVDASSDEALAKFVLATGSRGNVRTTTVRAFNEAEYRSIIGALP